MGVYIKDMELPIDGNETIIRIQPDGTILDQYGHHLAITAISVPPHGDLIDRDALEKEAQKRMLICGKNDNQFQMPYEIMRAIALAPTVIPAEEGET